MTTCFDFLALPKASIGEVISFLDLIDIKSLALSCKTLYELLYDNDKCNVVWRCIANRKFPELRNFPSARLFSNFTWKDYTLQRLYLTSSFYLFIVLICLLEIKMINFSDNAKFAARCRESISYYGGKLYLIGGQINSFLRFNQIFEFDPGNL